MRVKSARLKKNKNLKRILIVLFVMAFIPILASAGVCSSPNIHTLSCVRTTGIGEHHDGHKFRDVCFNSNNIERSHHAQLCLIPDNGVTVIGTSADPSFHYEQDGLESIASSFDNIQGRVLKEDAGSQTIYSALYLNNLILRC